MIDYIHRQVLQQFNDGLKTPSQYCHLACAVRLRTLKCLQIQLPMKQKPDFYGRVVQSFKKLVDYFDEVCREDRQMMGPPCEEIQTFQRTLQTYALRTEELQICYFRDIIRSNAQVEFRCFALHQTSFSFSSVGISAEQWRN